MVSILPRLPSTIKVNLKRRMQYKSSALSSNGDLYKEEGITFNDSWLEGSSNVSLVDNSDEFSESSENIELIQTVKPNRLLIMKMTGVKMR